MASHLIDGQWVDGAGEEMLAQSPTDGAIAWRGRSVTRTQIDCAIAAARSSLREWSTIGLAARANILRSFAERLKSSREALTSAIAISTGKPRWESATEVDAMVNKVGISIDIETKRNAASASESAGIRSATRFKPHGVCVVLGPFNFPGHLPNGHIVPALLAGNAILYKPSDLTPLVAELYTKLLAESGVPRGAFNLLQGDGSVGRQLCDHPDVDGIFFTGSHRVGIEIARANVERTGRILALEMGGNSPLVVHRVADIAGAAYAIVQSAFITAGQRCSCARRLIVLESESKLVLDALSKMTRSIRVGAYTDSPEPFIGPVITAGAAVRALQSQSEFQTRGGQVILEMTPCSPRENFLRPGIIDMTETDRGWRYSCDEVFAPLLQVIRVGSFEDAIAEANNTRFGLAAGLLSDDRSLWDHFFREIRAGVVNWNRPTTGASSALPFGGIGDSGNHRPGAAAAAEYCSYPVAVTESDRVALPANLLPGIDL